MKILEPTVHNICISLKELAKGEDDLFVFSFRADGKSSTYHVYNKGDGTEGYPIEDFPQMSDIIFTDTVNKVRTTLLEYMKQQKFNHEKGDGEFSIGYDGRTRTLNMIVIHNSRLGPAF